MSFYALGHKFIEDSDWANTNVGTNLFAISKLQPKYINQWDGSLASSTEDVSIIVPLNGASHFVFSAFDAPYKYDGVNKVVFYNAENKLSSWKTFVEGINSIDDANAKFLGLSFNLKTQGATPGKLKEWLKNNRYKLELGTIATQWSPAPEDLAMQSDLDDIKQQIADLKTKMGG